MGEIKTLLVHLDSRPDSVRRIARVRPLAERLGARIEVLYAVTPYLMQIAPAADAGAIVAAQLAACDAELRAGVKAAFDVEATALHGNALRWHETDEAPLAALRERAWAADLLVLGQHDPESAAGVPADFAASMLVETGKPALVLPYIDTPPLTARNVMVAWKATPESARALTAALPLLAHARQVHVVVWDEHGVGAIDDDSSARPALDFLSRHGISAALHHGGPPTHELGDMMLSEAADLQADLLVMGCYGHGRAREWALGGVSRTVLRSMTLPVLMVH